MEQVEELRETFLKELNSKGESCVHPKDLERVKKDNDWLRRFLLHHDNNLSLALNMLWETVNWRKEYGTNEINESSVKMEILVAGGFFSHGRDKDGCSLFIFKCKKYVKGAQDPEVLKKCVIYWMERLERQDNGKPISLFFDMENCGLANMDMEFIRYLIGLFKQYYPYFLNYILIFEMPWILSAAFKVIKSWLPEKAVQKIKFVSKKDIAEFVPLDQALTCWGGTDDYQFSFVSEVPEPIVAMSPPVNNKKVHFADGSPMLEAGGGSGDKEQDGGILSVQPPQYITFTKEGTEPVGTLELQNTDNTINLSYKFKTTSPEKFRVRPSAGCLGPGAKATITVTVLPGFQVSNFSRDKFLVMSMPIENANLTSQELADLWKNTAGKKLNQHHLKCIMKTDCLKNGSVASVMTVPSESDQSSIANLANQITKLKECQEKLHDEVKKMQFLQMTAIIFVLLLGIALAFIIKKEVKNVIAFNSFCEGVLKP